ncbi:hypothetical protein ACFS07_33835 [Undibacterium arcticum]
MKKMLANGDRSRCNDCGIWPTMNFSSSAQFSDSPILGSAMKQSINGSTEKKFLTAGTIPQRD